MNPNPCPLCESKKTLLFDHAMNRDYFLCNNCDLIFVPKKFQLDDVEEKKRYDFHQNSIDDSNYVRFLSQLFHPLIERLSPNSHGLDFGSGPEPVLAQLLEEKGFDMCIFDPFYANNASVLQEKYDFVSLTEVAEHFYNPAKEFVLLVSLLKPKGYLAVMTSRTDEISNFRNWHYQKDETHVCFYSNKSMQYIAKKHQLSLEIINSSVVIFRS